MRRYVLWLLLASGLPCLSGCLQSPRAWFRGPAGETASIKKHQPQQSNETTGTSPAIAERRVIPLPMPPGPPIDMAVTRAPLMPGQVKETSHKVKPAQHLAGAEMGPPKLLPQEIKAEPPKREPLIDALVCILEKRNAEALQHLQKYDQSAQDVYLRLFPVLAVLTQKKLDQLSAGEIAVLQETLSGLLVTLRPRTALVIEHMWFSENIRGHGDYQPLPENFGFTAATRNMPGGFFMVFMELRNFTSMLRDGQYETRLNTSVEIRPKDADPQSEPFFKHNFGDHKKPYRYRAMRHDLVHSFFLPVPILPPGNYTFTVQVVDETIPENKRVAKKSLPIRIVAQSQKMSY
ncbi:MAG: hypothetical protein L0Y72_29950 [Gemmataceae bacterium]|nr:hypothetical protein [Gemmataceae bacterium]MCI0743271.1 hypothetical protein [Gemmataceae bacterium]